MSSVLENVSYSSGKNQEFKEKIYIRPKQDFKIGLEKEFRIVRGNPVRNLFKSKVPVCKSWDGCIGKMKGKEGKFSEERDCEDCGYLAGIVIKGENGDLPIKCQPGYCIILEHPNPDKEYSFTLNTESRINLDNYQKELQKMDLNVDEVVTGITREESTRTNGSVFNFRFIRELVVQLSDDEKSQLNGIISMVKNNAESISVMEAKEMLMRLTVLRGISDERALRIATMVADKNGMITENSNFL
jgi:hypothetical protein